MISYAEDPNVGLRSVITVQGDREYRENCKHIIDRKEGKGKFYKKNRDCFEFDGKWYRTDSGYILFDHEKSEWLLRDKARNLKKGIVGFTKTGEPIEGFFSPNKFNNTSIFHRGDTRTKCIHFELLKSNGYVEALNNGVWYNIQELGGKSSSNYRSMTRIGSEYNYRNKGYNIEDNGAEFHEKVRDFKDSPLEISKEVRLYSRFLEDRTFGAEVELSEGFIPDYIQHRLGIVMCRDGSISGGEAVTIPLTGAKGLQALKNVAEEFKHRANVDINCSYHLHLGNIPQDRVFLCSLYILAYRIQDEIFEMFPYYKTDPRGVKRKNYCQKLDKMQIHPLKDKSREGFEQYIDEVYNRIFEFLSDGTPASQFNNKKQMRHPINNKWDRPSRYRWLNLQNMIFSPRHTAEFRLHQATLNSQKMTLWLFICNAIVKYAEKFQTVILMSDKKISFLDVLSYYAEEYPDSEEANILSNHLKEYYEERRKRFAEDMKNEDRVSDKDAKEDKKYVFQKPLF